MTLDAQLTQHKVTQAIADAEADYIMLVKANQPGLHEAIALAFADPVLLAEHPLCEARTAARGPGRLERHALRLSAALAGYLDRPEPRPVFQLVRTRTERRTGECSVETVYGITSLDRASADAAFVLALLRDAALNLLRRAGVRQIAARLRAHSQDPAAAIASVLAAPPPLTRA